MQCPRSLRLGARGAGRTGGVALKDECVAPRRDEGRIAHFGRERHESTDLTVEDRKRRSHPDPKKSLVRTFSYVVRFSNAPQWAGKSYCVPELRRSSGAGLEHEAPALGVVENGAHGLALDDAIGISFRPNAVTFVVDDAHTSIFEIRPPKEIDLAQPERRQCESRSPLSVARSLRGASKARRAALERLRIPER